MAQAYGAAFARLYDRYWSQSATSLAPYIRAFYEATPASQTNRSLLDVCCGTGQLARHFLDHGYRVVAVDLSPAMLDRARRNAGPHVSSGRATYIEADATNFTVPEKVGLAVSTFDSLNHLENVTALRSCFRRVFDSLVDEGVFVFDLNTKKSLTGWNNVHVQDKEDAFYVIQGVYDGGERAWLRVAGCVRVEDGSYERFSEVAFNTVFDTRIVRDALVETGWRNVWVTEGKEHLEHAEDDPEQPAHPFFVAIR